MARRSNPSAPSVETKDALIARIVADPEAFGISGQEGCLSGYGSYKSGGQLAEIPEPHVRLFDIPGYSREIRITVGRFPGFPHHYVTLEEQDNLIWNPTTKPPYDSPCWQKAWDDEDARGRRFETKYVKPQYIDGWISRTLEENFTCAYHIRYEGSKYSKLYKDGD